MTDPEARETMQVVVNPLSFIEVEHPTKDAEGLPLPPTAEAVLRYICEHVNSDPANLARRYRELTQQGPQIPVAPAQREIVEKMLVPLHSAIACYMTGSYYGTIALSGLVCEMLSILIFDMHDIRVGMLAFDEKKQMKLLGSTFEKLGQDRRVKVLHAFGVIKDEHLESFDRVREIRRRHLHFLAHDAATLPTDAATCFRIALGLAEMVFRAEFKDGAIGLRPQLMRYLRSKK